MIHDTFHMILNSAICLVALSCVLQASEPNSGHTAGGNTGVKETDRRVTVTTEHYTIEIEKAGFRYEFRRQDGTVVAPAHTHSGIQIGLADQPVSDVVKTEFLERKEDQVRFEVETENGIRAEVLFSTGAHDVKIQVTRSGRERIRSSAGRVGWGRPMEWRTTPPTAVHDCGMCGTRWS